MRKIVLVLGVLVVVVIVMRLLTTSLRENVKQHFVQMMQEMPDS